MEVEKNHLKLTLLNKGCDQRKIFNVISVSQLLSHLRFLHCHFSICEMNMWKDMTGKTIKRRLDCKV